MNKTKTPLARKIEGYSPSSDFANFEAFEARKSRKKLVWLWPILAVFLITLGLWTMQELNPKSENNVSVPKSPTPREQKTKSNDLTTSKNSISSQDLIEQQTNSKQKPTNLHSQTAKVNNATKQSNNQSSVLLPLDELPNSSSKQFLKLLLKSKAIGSFEYNTFGLSVPRAKEDELIKMRLNKPSSSRFSPSWMISIGPNLASNKLVLAPDANKYIHPDFEKILSNTVQSDVGLSLNITYSKPIYKGFSVYTGVGYTANKLTGYYKFKLDSVPVFDIDNSIAGFIQLANTSPLRNVDLGSANQSFNYITLPIGFSYSTTYKTYSFDAAIGTDLAYLTNARGNILDGKVITESRKLIDVINPKYTSFHTRFSVFRNLSETVQGGLTFGYSLQTNSLYNQPHYTIKNSAAEINAVIKFNLLKNRK